MKIEGKYKAILLTTSKRRLPYSNHCGIVLAKMKRYENLFKRAALLYKAVNCTVIGMAHRAEEKLDEKYKNEITDSQNKVLEALIKLQANLIGIEAFSGKSYSYLEVAREAYRQIDMPLPPMETLILDASVIREHVKPWGTMQYREMFPDYKFCGVEDISLQGLQWLLSWEYGTSGLIERKEFDDLYYGTLRLRGQVIISKFVELASKIPGCIPALPIGLLHIREIGEIKTEFDCPWGFINTVTSEELNIFK